MQHYKNSLNTIWSSNQNPNFDNSQDPHNAQKIANMLSKNLNDVQAGVAFEEAILKYYNKTLKAPVHATYCFTENGRLRINYGYLYGKENIDVEPIADFYSRRFDDLQVECESGMASAPSTFNLGVN